MSNWAKSFLRSNGSSRLRSCFLLGLMVWVGSSCWGLGVSAGQETPNASKFLICYNPTASIQDFEPYDIVVVDFAYPSKSVAALKQQGKTVFGYLSLGKVQKERPFLVAIHDLGIACKQDSQFPDSLQIDVADSRWQTLVLESIVPKMKKIGFNGIFLDDLDDLKIRKLDDHGVTMIKQIREANPDLKLMANRGLEYSAKFASSVDYLLLESCFVLDGKKRKATDSIWALQLLAGAKRVNPELKGVAIDYVSKREQSLTKTQMKLIREVRSSHGKNGLISCVSFQDLQSVPRY